MTITHPALADVILDDELAALEAAVCAQLPTTGRLGVAYSGGVDSAVLLAVAIRALGADRVLAVLAVSLSMASTERALAHRVAQAMGAQLLELETHEERLPAYRANDVNRCYHCKNELFERIDSEVAAAHRLTAVAYGENADDLVRLDRPGARAAAEHAVLRPLAQAGLTKAQVRALARGLRLEVADKPAAPCLASRIPHGQEVTAAKLAQVEAGEQALRSLGFSDCRLRHHQEFARIEVPADEIVRFGDQALRRRAVEALKAAGFRTIVVDLEGLKLGAFTLSEIQRNEGMAER